MESSHFDQIYINNWHVCKCPNAKLSQQCISKLLCDIGSMFKNNVLVREGAALAQTMEINGTTSIEKLSKLNITEMKTIGMDELSAQMVLYVCHLAIAPKGEQLHGYTYHGTPFYVPLCQSVHWNPKWKRQLGWSSLWALN